MNGKFLIVGYADILPSHAAQYIVRSVWDPGTQTASAWELVMQNQDFAGGVYDKPWLVAGGLVSAQPAGPEGPDNPLLPPLLKQEFYVVCWDNPNLADPGFEYAHSIDGGATWYTGDVVTDLDDPDDTGITGAALPVPRVVGNGPLYLAYLKEYFSARKIRIAVGTDVTSGQHAGEVEFAELLHPDSDPLEISLLATTIGSLVPGGLTHEPGGGMDLAVDPVDEGKLYLCYHDIVSVQSSDVDVSLRVLTRRGNGTWAIGDAIRVNNDNPQVQESDQFCPSIAVDADRVHLIFYDDRNHTQDDSATSSAKYDVFYAWADRDELDFSGGGQNLELCEDPPDCQSTEWGFDLDLWNYSGHPSFVEVGDYIGISVRDGDVWTSFTGTYSGDTNDDQSVIYSSLVLWQ